MMRIIGEPEEGSNGSGVSLEVVGQGGQPASA
jgi:hypothetical protein